jgi:hypothetical protein
VYVVCASILRRRQKDVLDAFSSLLCSTPKAKNLLPDGFMTWAHSAR